jgi:hypothetical protein
LSNCPEKSSSLFKVLIVEAFLKITFFEGIDSAKCMYSYGPMPKAVYIGFMQI